jgi:hypothetical protein
MNYEEFLDQPTTFMDDMVKLINIKHKYRLEFTQQEKEINQHIMTYGEEMKINALRTQFERCYTCSDVNSIKKGDKAKFIGCSKEQIAWGNCDDTSHLILDYIYTVDEVEVRSQHTKIKLVEKQGRFNSVCFEFNP